MSGFGQITSAVNAPWHKDHRAFYDIVEDAIFYATLPTIVRKLPAHSIGKPFFGDNWEDATGFVPDTYPDITPAFGRWMDAGAVFPMKRVKMGSATTTIMAAWRLYLAVLPTSKGLPR
jgi:hypothetical protein